MLTARIAFDIDADFMNCSSSVPGDAGLGWRRPCNLVDELLAFREPRPTIIHLGTEETGAATRWFLPGIVSVRAAKPWASTIPLSPYLFEPRISHGPHLLIRLG